MLQRYGETRYGEIHIFPMFVPILLKNKTNPFSRSQSYISSATSALFKSDIGKCGNVCCRAALLRATAREYYPDFGAKGHAPPAHLLPLTE